MSVSDKNIEVGKESSDEKVREEGAVEDNKVKARGGKRGYGKLEVGVGAWGDYSRRRGRTEGN